MPDVFFFVCVRFGQSDSAEFDWPNEAKLPGNSEVGFSSAPMDLTAWVRSVCERLGLDPADRPDHPRIIPVIGNDGRKLGYAWDSSDLEVETLLKKAAKELVCDPARVTAYAFLPSLEFVAIDRGHFISFVVLVS